MLGTLFTRCPHCEDRSKVDYIGHLNSGIFKVFSCHECGKSFTRGPGMEVNPQIFKPAPRFAGTQR